MSAMTSAENDARKVSSAIFRMVTSFRRQRGEFAAQGVLENSSAAPIAARHMGAAERILEHGPMTVGALARLLRIEMTTASKLATELEEAGIVRRRRDPADGRRILVDVVPEAHKQVHSFMSELRAPLERAVARLTPAEREAFLRGLTYYSDELDAEPIVSPPEQAI
jgi:DNA-binding MarR family transcriptional regulator